jgi:hypothetical protein
MIRNLSTRLLLILTCVALAVEGGCQKPPAELPPLYPATGTASFKNGGPVIGRIKFQPVDNSSFSADGLVGKDGKFSLSTQRRGSDERSPGVPAGTYHVTINATATRPTVRLPDPVQVQEGENKFAFQIDRK